MKRYHKTIRTTTVIVALLSVGYFLLLYQKIYLSGVKFEQKENLTVNRVEGILDLEVNANFWDNIKPETIRLFPQSARAPYGYSEKELKVKAAYNDREITFLLEFADSTETPGTPANPDACAILLTTADAPGTAQMMGYKSKANVWQWLADRNKERFHMGNSSIKAVRELVASGPGTQTPLPLQNVDGKGEYQDGKWLVVFKRELQNNQKDEFELKAETNMKIAFALWDGSRMESFSRKSISILRTLSWEVK